jgi:thioredoxin-dependent peroxiredoxin
MIDPSKATKGRRMSKKTRKKSPKTAPGKAARARSVTSAKKPASRTRRTTADKSRKKTTEQPTPTTRGASHEAPSKQLKKPDARPPRKTIVAEGAKAPAFHLPRDGGGTVSLADFSGKKLVLFFYPRADTPGCTREAIDFTRLSGAFAERHTALLGVSADPLKAQESFRDRHQLKTPLVSDEQHKMLEAYGVWGEKSMYGRTFQGILRTTVLIGADGQSSGSGAM